jgi:hypothetical protein
MAGRKTLDKAEAQRIGSLGGKAKWAKLSPAERSKRMKAVRNRTKMV